MSKKILCIEDSPVNVEIICAILERLGYEITVASEGYSAIALAKTLNPDLILMDLHLPGIDGIETTRLIKSNEQLSHIPIIAITADIYARNNFLEAGGDVYVTKPIRSGSLLRAIEQASAGLAAK